MLKRIILLLVIVFVLVGCNSNSTYEKLMSEAEVALESGDFENALKVYNSALGEVPESAEVKDMIGLLENYSDLSKKIDGLDWTEAFDLANGLLKNDAIPTSLQKEVKELLTAIEGEKEKEKKVEEEIASELKKIGKLVHDDDVEKASSKLSELESKIKSNVFDKEIEELYSDIEVAEAGIAEKERHKKEEVEIEAEKKRLEEESKQRASRENGLYAKYLLKAESIDAEIRREVSNYTEVPNGLIGDYGEKWDDLLNEVWGVLKDTMPSNEFEKLKAEQIEWIKNKDKGFAEIGDDRAYQRLMAWDYLSVETEGRTYYLIEHYLN